MSNRYKTLAIFFVCLMFFPQYSHAKKGKAVRTHKKHVEKPYTLVSPVKHRGFSPNTTSIEAVEISSGKTIVSHHPDLKLNPASCAKILTSAAALSELNPSYRLQTDFLADNPPRNGVISHLYVAGTGDPLLINEEIEKIAAELYGKGIRKITGGIIIDNSFFDSYEYPHKETGEGRAYTALTAATAVNFNSIEVVISPRQKMGQPAIALTSPPMDTIRVVNKVLTGKRTSVSVQIKEAGGDMYIVAAGKISVRAEPQKIYRSVPDPARLAGEVIKSWLKNAGINVAGKVKSGKTPQNATPILRWQSKPLSEIVKEMNKRSNNFIAEQLLKHLGAIRYGRPGSTEKGVRAIHAYLSSIGVPAETVVMENGSGLSEISRISADALVKVLVASYKDKNISDAFVESFSILGVDGTTKRWRSHPRLTGKALVKTGTINNVSTLAGYVQNSSGKATAFAILVNGLPKGVAGAHEAQLNMLRSIMETTP